MIKAIMIAYDRRVNVLNGEKRKHNYKERRSKLGWETAQISKGKDKSKASYGSMASSGGKNPHLESG